MTQPVGKTYLPTFDLKLTETCEFVTKHATVILAATALLSPTDYAAMSTAISAIQSACELVGRIHRLQDPNYRDNTAD